MKYFVMSDIHSFGTLMENTLKEKGFDINNEEHKLVICGDLFDRGDESLKVFNFVKSIPKNRLIYIRGNHEDLLLNCYNQFIEGTTPSSHHFSNGTVKTILDLCGLAFEDAYILNKDIAETIYIKMQPILEFIEDNTADFYETKNYIFTHGWIPCDKVDNLDYTYIHKYLNNWRASSKSCWEMARWTNGMLAWKDDVKEPNKTIVCGHWHCSFGNSHYHLDKHLKEFPQKNKKDFEKSFEPFVDDGIIAIDSCTSYSGLMNCLVLEE